MFASRSEINGLTFCAASLFDALVYRLTNSVFSIALFAMCIVLHVFRVYTDESRVNHQPHEKLYNRVTPRSRWWWNNKPFLLPATRCRGSTSPHSPTILPPPNIRTRIQFELSSTYSFHCISILSKLWIRKDRDNKYIPGNAEYIIKQRCA